MKIISLVLALLLLFLSGCGNSTTALAQPQSVGVPQISPIVFNGRVAALKEEFGARAVVAGVWQGNQEVSTLALGPSMTGVPASTDMTVRIGGVSQLFLGTLVMRLVEQGHFALDDKVSKWFPELFQAESVTVGMLIKNQGGYKDYVLEKDFVDAVIAEPFRQFSSDEIIEYSVRDKESNFFPGTSQKYSHTEFTILKKVIEKATGNTMADLYQKEIFSPLGLSRTGYSSTPDLPSPVLHAFSSDREVYEDCTFWNPSWAGESGPLYSTLDDLGKWGPAFGKGLLLTEATFQELIRRPEAAPSENFYFASGFVVAGGWYFQNPNINGYSGMMGYLPALDITLVVFATQPEKPESGHPAMAIFLELVKEIAPGHPINLQ